MIITGNKLQGLYCRIKKYMKVPKGIIYFFQADAISFEFVSRLKFWSNHWNYWNRLFTQTIDIRAMRAKNLANGWTAGLRKNWKIVSRFSKANHDNCSACDCCIILSWIINWNRIINYNGILTRRKKYLRGNIFDSE